MTQEILSQKLGIPTRTIRFWARQGLLGSDKKGRRKDEYSLKDGVLLQKIWVFRKSGVSVETLIKLTQNEIPLSRALEDTRGRLEEEESEKNGALSLLNEMAEAFPDTKATWQTLDAACYFEKIREAEKAGDATFFDLENEHLYVELATLNALFDRSFTKNFQKNRRRHGLFRALLGALAFLLFVCLAKGALAMWLHEGSFREGVTDVLLPLALLMIILVPLLLIGRRSPKAAGYLMRMLWLFCLAVLVVIVALVLWGFIESVWA